MNFVKSLIPFTDENRILRDSIVEGTKAILRLNVFNRNNYQVRNAEEENNKSQGLKRNVSMPSRIRTGIKKTKPNPIEETPTGNTRLSRATSQKESRKSVTKPVVRRRSFVPADNRQSGKFCNACDGKENKECHEKVTSIDQEKVQRRKSFHRLSSVTSASGESISSSGNPKKVLFSMENVTFTKSTKSAQAKVISSPVSDKPSLNQKVKSFPNTLRSYNKLPNKESEKASTSNLHRPDSMGSINSTRSVRLREKKQIKQNLEKSKSSSDISVVQETNMTKTKPTSHLDIEEEIPIRMELPPLLINENFTEELQQKIINWDIESISEGFIDDDFNLPEFDDSNAETVGIITQAEDQIDKLKDELNDVFQTISVITRKMGNVELRQTEV
ncbi:hypothetical protein HHI36_011052 [Cryptolaemus montrouzieri]|uniref:Uncharacterized protein n=1 Tax=Cryptolaemus montrouzieri TaxID=559131 RepID=A0ABD2MKK2_9CUCU